MQFVVHGDFITTSDRGDIITNHAWNRHLRDAIPAVAVAGLLALQKWSSLTHTWMRYLGANISDPFFQPVHEQLLLSLRRTAILLSLRGERCCPQDIVSIPSWCRDSKGHPLIPPEYALPKHYICTEYDMARDGKMLRALGVEDFSAAEFVTALSKMDDDDALQAQTASWWDAVYRALAKLAIPNQPLVDTLRVLNVIPLVDGRWVAANAGKIYFDSRSADIPRDLGLMLVKPFSAQSARRTFFTYLGVTKLNPQEVANHIEHRHQNDPDSLDSGSLISHAQYLFDHRSEIDFPSLFYVLTEDGSVIDAEDVYVDHPDYEPQLSGCLQSPAAHFLAPGYRTLCYHTPDLYDELDEWLMDEVGVNLVPKFSASGLSLEFSDFLNYAPTADILEFLKSYGRDFVEAVLEYSNAAKELRETLVATSTGVMLPLHTTFLKRGALARFRHLPFLSIPDPEDSAWDVLMLLGVTCVTDVTFYLQELTRLSERAPREVRPGQDDPTLKEVIELYKQLEARFFDSTGGANIRQVSWTIHYLLKRLILYSSTAFRTRSLIYIPPNPTSSPECGSWVSSEDAVWKATPARRKVPLEVIYDQLQTFFCDYVLDSYTRGMGCVQELGQFILDHVGKPLIPAAVAKIHAILSDISVSCPTNPQARRILAGMPCLPARKPDGEIRLYNVPSCVFPDSTGELAKFFTSTLSLVVRAPDDADGDGLQRLCGLFESIPGAMFLDSVQKEPVRDDEITWRDVALSIRYQSRLHYLKR